MCHIKNTYFPTFGCDKFDAKVRTFLIECYRDSYILPVSFRFFASPTLIAISALQRDNLGHATEITKKILHFIRLTLPLQGLTRMCIVI